MHTVPKTALLLTALLIAGGTSCDKVMAKLKDPFNKNDPARVHRQKGIDAFKHERWAEAADEWAASLAAKPEQRELYEKQAFAAAKAGRLDEAAQTLQKTIAFKETPKDKLDVTRKIAAMYMQGNRPDKAEQHFLEILKQEPKDDATITWLGEIHSQLGGARAAVAPADLPHLEQAIAYYDQASALNPDNPTPYVNKRIALIKTVDYWQQKKNAADKEEAELPKKKKKEKAEAKARSDEFQAKIDELKPKLEETTAKLSEAMKKKAGAAATPAAATPAAAADAGSATAEK
jgi:tetratricopeptide (TPR) repeat protein